MGNSTTRRHATTWAILAIVTSTALSQAATTRQVRCLVDADWPKKPNDITWAAMSGIAVDAHDHIHLFTRSDPAVQVYHRDGTLLRTFSTTDPNGAHQIKFDPDGNVWLTNYANHVIEKRTPQGKLLLTLGQPGQPGCDDTHFNGPTDIAFLPAGDLFISDGYGNRRIVHLDRHGRFVRQWGREGIAPGQFALPHAIAIDDNNRIYVADRNNARIQVFDTAGKLLALWDGLIVPWGLTVTKDNEIWVCGSSPVRLPDDSGWVIAPPPDQLLLQLSPEGKTLLRVPLPYSAAPNATPGAVNWVHCIAVDSHGDLYLGDIQGRRAQKFSLHTP